MDGRWCTPEYHVPDFFFSAFLVYLIFLLRSPVLIFKSWLMREDSAFQFQAEGEAKSILFTYVYSRQSFSCEIVAQREASKPIPTPQRKFLFSEECSSFPTIKAIQPASLFFFLSRSLGTCWHQIFLERELFWRWFPPLLYLYIGGGTLSSNMTLTRPILPYAREILAFC